MSSSVMQEMAEYFYEIAMTQGCRAHMGTAYVVVTDSDDPFPELHDKDAVLVWKHDTQLDIILFSSLDEALSVLEKAEYATRTLN